jgi:hypothetical protein
LVTHLSLPPALGLWGVVLTGIQCQNVGIIGGNNFYAGNYVRKVLGKRTMIITVTEAPASPAPTVINEYAMTASATIYPNPASDNIKIKFENIEGNTQVRIVNAIGVCVLDQIVNVTKEDVNIILPELTSGIYFVNIISDKAVLTRKLIINK